MASTEGLVPITRAFLASYYDKYPLDPPLSADVSILTDQIHAMAADLLTSSPPTQGETLLVQEAKCEPPHKVDENMWKHREQIEEIIFSLDASRLHALHQQSTDEDVELASVLGQIQQKFISISKVVENFQSRNSEYVYNTVMTYLPQDFRGTIIRQQRERSERIKQAAVDAVTSSGGSIRDKYVLLWKQQMDRRRQLAELGSATGVYKTLVKYLVGVPEVLLDFVRQLNDDQGPMEEQRQRYGPPLYSLTRMVYSIRLFLSLLCERLETRKLPKNQLSVLEQAVAVYTAEFERYINFFGEVLRNSPFFISAADAGMLGARDNDEHKEVNVLAGKNHEVSLTVESVNSYIAWDFSVAQGKMNMDIGFSVECTDPSGKNTMILPYRRYGSDQGNFCTCISGNYKLIWDNSYSTFFKKVLRYKVDCIPPVTDCHR